MSLVLSAATPTGAVLVADSAHVDVVSGMVSTGFAKVGAEAGALFGVAGVCDHNGFDVRNAIRHVLAARTPLDDVAHELMAQFGPDLLALYQAWARLPRPTEELPVVAQDCLSVVLAAPGLLVELWSVVGDGMFSLAGTSYLAEAHVRVRACGTADGEVRAVTDDGREAALALALGERVPVRAVVRPPPPLGTSVGMLERELREVVDGAVDRQGDLPRPSWLPPTAPLLAGPPQVVRLGS